MTQKKDPLSDIDEQLEAQAAVKRASALVIFECKTADAPARARGQLAAEGAKRFEALIDALYVLNDADRLYTFAFSNASSSVRVALDTASPARSSARESLRKSGAFEQSISLSAPTVRPSSIAGKRGFVPRPWES